MNLGINEVANECTKFIHCSTRAREAIKKVIFSYKTLFLGIEFGTKIGYVKKYTFCTITEER